MAIWATFGAFTSPLDQISGPSGFARDEYYRFKVLSVKKTLRIESYWPIETKIHSFWAIYGDLATFGAYTSPLDQIFGPSGFAWDEYY